MLAGLLSQMTRAYRPHYSEVRRNTSQPTTNTTCNEDQWILKGMNLVSNEHTRKTETRQSEVFCTRLVSFETIDLMCNTCMSKYTEMLEPCGSTTRGSKRKRDDEQKEKKTSHTIPTTHRKNENYNGETSQHLKI